MNGLKIVQRGIDVSQAADYQTVLDSRWPLVQYIDHLIDITLPSSSTMIVYTHNLGYAPGWEFYPDGGDVSSGYTDQTNFYTTDTGLSQHIQGRLRLYLHDFHVPYKSDSITISPDTETHNQDTGMKIVDTNEGSGSMRSSDYNDFSLNTNAKALSLHMVGNQAINSTTGFADIVHSLGYLPTFMAWQSDSTASRISQINTFSFANTINLSFRGAQAVLTGYVAYLILKDPVVLGL